MRCVLFELRNSFLKLYFSGVFRFDRDWKKIEDFVGSKTVIQVNYHLISLSCF